MNHRPFRRALLVACIAAVSLAGCDDGDDAPETLRATNDVATAQRGASTDVDVLANDVASAGGQVSLSRISVAPSNGQAVISGTRVRYTPNPNHVGTDRLSYVARLANGTEAAGELTISTEARVTLKGTVADGPIANAAVQLEVGDRRYTATANAQGAYQIEAVLRQPGEMLRLEAAGVGTQATARLSSLAGDASTLLAAAGTATEVNQSTLGGLRVTNVSTAQEALVREANNGTAPATQVALEAAQARLDPVQLITIAASVKLVIDGGIALPAGTLDTLALARTPAVREAFATQNAAALSQMVVQVAGDPSLGLPAFSPLAPGVTSATQLYFFGRGGVGQDAYRVVYRSDGTAEVTGGGRKGSQSARWSLDNGDLTVRFDPAWATQTQGFATNPATGLSEPASYEFRLHALHVRVLAGTRDSATVQLSLSTSFLQNGVVQQPETRGSPYVFQQRAISALDAALRTEDFAVGSRWGGLGFIPTTAPSTDSLLYTGMADLLEFRADGVARQTITGQESRWQVTDGVLELRRADGERLQYRRLQRVAAREQRWVVERFPAGGGPVELMERLVVQQDPTLVFTQASLPGLWLSQVNLLTSEGNSRFFVRLRADGTAGQVSSNFDAASGTWTLSESNAGAWSLLLSDGSMRVLRTTGTAPVNQNLRDWIPLAREGNKLMVLEWRAIFQGTVIDRARDASISGWRTNIYTLEPTAY